MKKIFSVILIIAMVFVFSGCMDAEMKVTINEDGTSDVSIYNSISYEVASEALYNMTYDELVNMDPDIAAIMESDDPQYEEAQAEIDDLIVSEIDATMGSMNEGTEYQIVSDEEEGVSYYIYDKELEGASIADSKAAIEDFFGEGTVVLTKKAFKINLKETMTEVNKYWIYLDEQNEEPELNFQVTLPYEVKKTNGKLADDKKTVTWTYDELSEGTTLYAYAKDSTKPTVTGVKDGKSYKSKATIKVSDKDSGIKSAVVKNAKGKKVASFTKSTTIKKKGSYTLTVLDNYGNKKVVKFTIK